jgi:small subunit ribosomal protein S6
LEQIVNEYEIAYILRPSLEDADVEARVNQFAEIVKSQGGEVVAIERMGRKRLAYEIADLREGNYVVMRYRSSGDASKELERQLNLHEDVVRELTVRLDKHALEQMARAQSAPPPAAAAAQQG